MKRVSPLSIAVLSGALLLAVAPAMASTFLAMNPDELVAKSEAVVEGTVLKVDSFWEKSGRVIVSEAVIEVADTITGKSVERVTVRTFGGEVDGYVVEASGFPRFQTGERVVLFLHRDSNDKSVRVTGYQLGHYRVVERGGTKPAMPTFEGARLLSKSGGEVAAPEALPLSELKQNIEDSARKLAQGSR